MNKYKTAFYGGLLFGAGYLLGGGCSCNTVYALRNGIKETGQAIVKDVRELIPQSTLEKKADQQPTGQ